MSKIIQHLRADRETWAQHDIIPEDGELALLRIEGGGTLIKIGNGEHPFSALDSLTGEVKINESDALLLRHGEDTRCGEKQTLAISFPSLIREDYYATVSFDSPLDGETALSYPAEPKIHFSGDDVLEGVFVPAAGMHYTLLFWHDGRMQGLVRGVKLDS